VKLSPHVHDRQDAVLVRAPWHWSIDAPACDINLGGGFMSKQAAQFLTRYFCLPLFVCCLLSPLPVVDAQEQREVGFEVKNDKNAKDAELTLAHAVMCESVQNLRPINQAVTFSVSGGHVYCLSTFKSVPKTAIIYHRWFRRNELSTQVKLKVYPPYWTTYSLIQLREEDKGPWHVEISSENGKVFEVLRFSITD
jgi:hypothetical protein